MIFGRRLKTSSKAAAGADAPAAYRVDEAGLILVDPGTASSEAVAATALLDQHVEDGSALRRDGAHVIPWDRLYELLSNEEEAAELAILKLPPTIVVAPRLSSSGSLVDPDFAIAIDGWLDADRRVIQGARLSAGTLQIDGIPHLLPSAVWQLVKSVRRFAARSSEDRSDAVQRRLWGEIRQQALAAGAPLDDFLYRTVVLTPDKLQLALRRSEGLGLVEIEPWFEGAPTDWLAAFDRTGQVRERYDLITPEGVVQVMISPQVGTVLRELKRLPARRVTGERAQAFLLNPVAALGPEAGQVVDEAQFDAAKTEAGIVFDRFAAIVPETHGGEAIGLLVTSVGDEQLDTRELLLEPADVKEFVAKVEDHIARGLQLCTWDEYEFELDGDSALHCDALSRALARLAASVILHGEIYDLTGYSERVEGIGQEKPIYSPHIARKRDDEGWFPENLAPLIAWTDTQTGEFASLPMTDALIEAMLAEIAEAEPDGRKLISVPGCPTPMPIAEAKSIISTMAQVRREAQTGTFDPASSKRPGKRPTLILKENIERIDYREERLAALTAPRQAPRPPSGLRSEVQLKHHQLAGLSWMQHLFALAPDRCRGALLADDMGLGKTLQILCLIARAREEDPTLPPALVVAPLSLLENWREEAEKFLMPGTVRLLTAYGDGLRHLRVGRSAVDEQLRREGLVRFLRPDWRGDADLVLTTYETLRDLEFSFARERWSIMVCDEAQKIKNPSAAMTKAAKKQQAAFRIACTGTPVENSLVDLWCLFDFVQPGLLGALNDFGRNFRRPIEAEGENDRARIEELRALVAPQLLRRMKSEVAADLKDKLVDEECRRLPMSAFQRGLYAGAIDAFKRKAENTNSAGHLGLLHRLRLLCSEPGGASASFDGLAPYRSRSPKLDWLISLLVEVRSRKEKAIVFCEFKDVQRLLRHYIREAFAIPVDIINGDTSAAAGRADSRQKRIRAFQEQEGFGVIILSPVAVGFGVNMQAANHVVHFTRTWNPAKEDQATDRAYRIGQTRDVFVYYPTVGAPDFKTFDVKLDELLERKRSLAGDMLNGTGEISIAEFDLNEIDPMQEPSSAP